MNIDISLQFDSNYSSRTHLYIFQQHIIYKTIYILLTYYIVNTIRIVYTVSRVLFRFIFFFFVLLSFVFLSEFSFVCIFAPKKENYNSSNVSNVGWIRRFCFMLCYLYLWKYTYSLQMRMSHRPRGSLAPDGNLK